MKEPDPATNIESSNASFPQPIDLLRRLAGMPLPARIVDRAEIEILRILKLGGSVKAAIPEAARLPGGLGQTYRAAARVDEVTRLGQSMLRHFAG